MGNWGFFAYQGCKHENVENYQICMGNKREFTIENSNSIWGFQIWHINNLDKKEITWGFDLSNALQNCVLLGRVQALNQALQLQLVDNA